jgi:hypothetical protein
VLKRPARRSELNAVEATEEEASCTVLNMLMMHLMQLATIGLAIGPDGAFVSEAYRRC